MDIEFFWSHCGQSLVIDESAGGITVDCPKCNKPAFVPSKPAAPAKPTPPPEQPVRVTPKKFAGQSPVPAKLRRNVEQPPSKPIKSAITSAPLDKDSSAAPSTIVQTGWRLLCAYAIVALVGLFVLDNELKNRFEVLQRMSRVSPQDLSTIQLEIQNPVSARSSFLELLDWAETGLLVVVGICAVIALTKDQIKPGLLLLAAAGITFGVIYFAATQVVHNRTQPMIDQTNQQLQQMQQSLDNAIQQMRQLGKPRR